MPSLVTSWAGTVSWSGAIAPVHALWIAQCRLTILTHVAFGADTDLILIANALVGALFVTLRVRSFNVVFVQFVSLGLFRFEQDVNHSLCVFVCLDGVCDGFGIHDDHVVPLKV